MQMRRVSRSCAVSGEADTHIQTSVWIPKHTGKSGGWEDERGSGGRERQSSYVARKPVFSSPSSSLTKQRATRVDTFVLPLYSPLGYLFWEGTMHNKGLVLHPLTGWDADTPQLIMCLSVAVWAAANGIKSSIFEQCSAHSRTQCCTSQISTVF